MSLDDFIIGEPLEATKDQLAESSDFVIGTSIDATSEAEAESGVTAADAAKIPGRLGQRAIQGAAGGLGTLAKAGTVFGLPLEESAQYWQGAEEGLEPEGTSPVPLMTGMIEPGVQQTAQSGVAGFIPAVAGGMIGGIPGAVVGLGLGAGAGFGGAQYYDFMKEIERVGTINGATPEEIARAKEAVKSYGVYEGLMEGVGESISAGAGAVMGLLTAGMLGPAAKTGTAAVAKPLMKRLGNYATKLGITGLTEIGGEELTTVSQYGFRGAALEKLSKEFDWMIPEQTPLGQQIKETALQTGGMIAVQAATGGLIRAGGAVTNRRDTVDAKTTELVNKYNIGSETAKTVSEKIIEKPDEKAADRAIASLDEAKTGAKKKTKAQSIVKTITAAEEVSPQLELPLTQKPTEVEIEDTSAKRHEVVVPAQDEEDSAAVGIRVANKIGIAPADMTVAQLAEATGIVDSNRVNAIYNATQRKIQGYVGVKEAEAASVSRPMEAPEPAPTEVATVAQPPTLTKEAQQNRLLELGQKSDEDIAAELGKLERSAVVEFAKANSINYKGNTNTIRNRITHYAKRAATNILHGPTIKSEEKGPEAKIKVTFNYMWDFGPEIEGAERFKPMVRAISEGKSSDVIYDPNKHELTNPEAYDTERAKTAQTLGREEVLGKVSEGAAIEAKAVAEPTSVENLNLVDKQTHAELVAKIKAVGGGEFFEMIRRLVHPRGEGMSSRDVAYAEGMDDLWQEAGIPKSQWIQAVRSVAYASKAYTAEEVVLDRFAEGVDFDVVVGHEYDRLIDSGRANELEKLNLTEEQIEAVLQKEAEVEAERVMQEKYNVLDEDITDHSTADTESTKLETDIAVQAEEEVVLDAQETEEVDEEQTFTTKREALAERAKKDKPGEWTAEKVKDRQWTLKRAVQAAAAPLDSVVTKHSAYQTREEAQAAMQGILETGVAPNRFSNPKGFLESLRGALSLAYTDGNPVTQATKILNEISVDLSQQAHKYGGDTKFQQSLLGEVRRLQDYALKITEAIEDNKVVLKGLIKPADYMREYKVSELAFIANVENSIGSLNDSGGATANHLIDLVLSWNRTPLYHKVFLKGLQRADIASYLENVDVVAVPRSKFNVSHFERYVESTEPFSTKAQITLDIASLRRNLDSVGSMIHELLHGLMSEALDTVPRFNDAITTLRMQAIAILPMSDQVRIAGLRADDIGPRKMAKTGLSGSVDSGVYYGLTNNHEFISQTMTDSNMMMFLSTAPAVKPVGPSAVMMQGDTLWARFKRAVGQFVLGYTAPNEYTLLDEVFKTTTEIFTEFTTHQADMKTLKNVLESGTLDVAKRDSTLYKGMSNDMDEIYSAINDGDIMLVGYKKRDANWFSQMFVSPEAVSAIKSDPLAYEMVGMNIDAVDQHLNKRGIGLEELDRIFKGTDKKGRILITTAMRNVEKGQTLDAQKLEPRLKAAAESLFRMKESYRLRMQDMMRTMLFRSMNQTEKRIFQDTMINGKDASTATKQWNSYARKANKQRAEFIKNSPNAKKPNREATTTYATMKDYFERYAEAGKWGFDDYVTRAVRGSIVVVDEKGRVIAVAETTKQAADKAVNFLREVEAGTIEPGRIPLQLFISSDFQLDKDAPSLVTSRQYNIIRGKVQRAMTIESKAITAHIDKAVANKILRKVISVRPRQVWTPFTEERKDILKGEEDISTIMPLYIHSMERKMAFDPYIQYHRKHIDEFNNRPGIKAILEQQLEDSRGKFWVLDRIADSFMKQLGLRIGEAESSIRSWLGDKNAVAMPPEWSEKPFAATRAIRDIRLVTANLKLGYRNIASIINLMSGMGHTWIKTGFKYMYNAAKILRTEEGKKFMERYAPNLGTSLSTSEAGEIRSMARWWTPLGTFQLAETPNREVSFVSTYLMSRDQGLNEEQAVEAAKRGVRLQQFNYNIASLPKILRGPGGRLIGQFKSYLMKEIEFMRSLTPGEWVKYTAMQIALGGPRGMMITLKSMPPTIVLMGLISGLKGGGDWLDEVDEWMNSNLPRLSRGMFGFFGIDASGPASFQFPTDMKDWMGITVSAVMDFAKDVAQPFIKGEKYVKWNLYEYSKQQVPIWKVWSDMIESSYHDGWIWDKDGNKKYQVETPEDWIKAAAGGKPLRLGIVELQNRLIAKQQNEERDRVNSIVTNAVHLRRKLGDDGVVRQIVQDCMEYKVAPETLVSAIERAEIDPLMRKVLKSKLADKLDIWIRARRATEAAQSVR